MKTSYTVSHSVERGNWIPKEREVDKRRDFVSGRGESVCVKLLERHGFQVKCDMVSEDTVNLRFEMGVQSSVSEMEQFLVMLCLLNS